MQWLLQVVVLSFAIVRLLLLKMNAETSEVLIGDNGDKENGFNGESGGFEERENDGDNGAGNDRSMGTPSATVSLKENAIIISNIIERVFKIKIMNFPSKRLISIISLIIHGENNLQIQFLYSTQFCVQFLGSLGARF